MRWRQSCGIPFQGSLTRIASWNKNKAQHPNDTLPTLTKPDFARFIINPDLCTEIYHISNTDPSSCGNHPTETSFLLNSLLRICPRIPNYYNPNQQFMVFPYHHLSLPNQKPAMKNHKLPSLGPCVNAFLRYAFLTSAGVAPGATPKISQGLLPSALKTGGKTLGVWWVWWNEFLEKNWFLWQ